MEYKLKDLIDIHLFQNLQDKLNEIFPFPSAILDNEGNILTGTAWQNICTKFHRANPESELECRKSDQYIINHLHEANPSVTYKCLNGMIDIAIPIKIDGKHLGAFFTGQFFKEKPDSTFFIKQAKQYGFDEKAYLEALSRVPIWSEEQLQHHLSVMKTITEILAEMGYKNLREFEERKIIEEQMADLKQMERSLRKSENRFKQIAENSSDFIWEVDSSGLYTYCSDKITNILGYSPDEVVGCKYFYDFFAPEIRDNLKISAFSVFKRKKSFRNNINPNIHKNGQTVILETSGSPILDEHGNLIGYRGADTDITQRMDADQKLQHSHEAFKNYFELGSVGMCVTSPEKNWIEINARVCQMLGYSKGELQLHTWADLTHPDDLAADVELFNQVLSGERNSYDLDKRFIRKDGSILYSTLSVICQRNEDGSVHHCLASLIDITDRKMAEQDYKREKAFMDKLFESSPEAISVSDEGGQLVRSNTKFLELFGFTKEEVLGKKIDHLIAPDNYHDEAVEITNALAHSGGTIELESIRHRKDGTPVDVSIIATSINIGDLFIGAYGIYRDITERKSSEKALRESEELYRNLIARMPDGVYKSTHEGRFIEANPAMVRMLGYDSKEDLFSIDIKTQLYFDPSDRESLQLEENLEELGVYRLKRKDGSEIWVEDHGWYNVDEHGEILIHEGILRDVSERISAEAALKKSERDYRNLFESANDSILIFDPESEVVLDANNHACVTYGFPKSELVGLSLKQITNNVQRGEQLIQELLQRGRYEEFETMHFNKEGSPIHFLINLSVIEYNGKKVILSIHRDITERKQIENKLMESEEKFRFLAEYSPNMIFINIKGRIVYANDLCEKVMGYTKEELYSSDFNFLKLIAPEYQQLITESFRFHMADQDYAPYEYALLTKDGKKLHTMLSTKLIHFGGENAVLGVVTDITERKRAEEVLIESEERFRSLYENISIGLYRTTPEGKILFANPALISILGFNSFEELAERNLEQAGFEPDYLRSDFRQQIECDGIVKGLESKWRRHDRKVIYVRENAKVYRDSQGKIKYYEGTIEDITDRKLAELQLTKQTEELTELNATKDKFFSIIAHDLKNPFNTILGFTNVLLTNFQEFDTDEILKYLNIIDNSSKHAFTLLENLLLWARTQTGTIDFHPEVIDLQSSVIDIIALLDNQAKKKYISIINNIEDRCFAYADKNMIETILRNLLTNAIKFTPKNGSVVVSITDQNDQIEISVRDTGVGIAKDDMEYIFRIDRKTTTLGTEKEKGTGLGLVLCKEFVEKHGGKISVESEFGIGSTFKFTIPLSK